MIGYHFVGATLRDGRPVPENGVWLIHDGDVVPCESGLHASEHPFDALRYALGSILCLVELDGDLVSHGNPVDKWAGRRRKILKRIDATLLLRRFAADQALSVAHIWEMPQVMRQYLTTLDPQLRDAACHAARDAACHAARDDARAAARDALWAARMADAWAAARAAARNAARDALWDDAWAAARMAATWADAARMAATGDAVRKDFLVRVGHAFQEVQP